MQDSPIPSRVRSRIGDDPTGNHPLQELADSAHMSRFQLILSFVLMTGLTPHAYLRHGFALVPQEAAEALLQIHWNASTQ